LTIQGFCIPHLSENRYIKTESNEWLFREYEGESAIVSFASVEVQMSMLDIYELVVFETQETEVQE
jgi:hypothetical protein